MNRTIKEATVRIYHYENHAQLRALLAAFLDAYYFIIWGGTLDRKR